MREAGGRSPKSIAGRAASKRSRVSPFRPKVNLGLAINTNVSRHQGQKPQEIFPADNNVGRSFPDGCERKEAVSSRRIGLPTRPDVFLRGSQALRRRTMEGIRPSPLDLNANQKSSVDHSRLDAVTPTIIITPAKETFDQNGLLRVRGVQTTHRPASSVYSREPGTADFEATPPVPPLPLFALQSREIQRSTATIHEDLSAGVRSQQATLSVCTMFEEERDESIYPPPTYADSVYHHTPKRLASQSTLPTPRRSRGWWNVLVSPFSTRSGGMFWRSPTQTPLDRVAIVDDSADMGTCEKWLATTESESDEIRSAPAIDKKDATMHHHQRSPPRSVTAPGALDANAPEFNIYRIPSQGEAAAYYDQTRHFPSIYVGKEKMIASPLTDVCACERHNHSRVEGYDGLETLSMSSEAGKNHDRNNTPNGPFSDDHEVTENEVLHHQNDSLFTSPTPEELMTTTPLKSDTNRSMTQTVCTSHFSPLSATPTLHAATAIEPSSLSHPANATRGIEPSVANTTARDLSPAATPAFQPTNAKLSQRQVYHARSESYGLGISGSETSLFPPPHSGSETCLFPPPPKPLSEKPRLGTDRFGQLKLIIPKDESSQKPWYRRFFWLLASSAAFLLLLLVMLLVMLIPQRPRDMPVQGQWLNLAGFPPLPTGITTVVQPRKVRYESGCVKPTSLWSCAVPAAQQSVPPSIVPDQPNFRFEIRFVDASTKALNVTMLSSAIQRRSGSTAVHARSLQARNAFRPTSPPAPSDAEQIYLGNTTDNITTPYAGEETPFFLSLLDASPLLSLRKRQEDTDHYPYPYPVPSTKSNSTSTTQNTASTTSPKSIPKPALAANSHPAPAVLYPYAQSQPLRLYDRGLESEHYGFSTFFDRSLYLSANSSANTPLNETAAVCTWSQTRLRVQIWTRRGFVGTNASTLADNATLASGVPAINSTANDMLAPGSFPYKVTISLDRHGGDAGRKGVYCYGIDGEQQVTEQGLWVVEDRAFGGTLIDAAEVPGIGSGNGTVVQKRDQSTGSGVDGRTGGCGCGWENWE